MSKQKIKLDHTELKKEDFTFSYDYSGYQIVYKGKRIGGAGTNTRARRSISNCEFHRQQAKNAIRDILEKGSCPKFMKQNIIDIDDGNLDWLEK